MDFTTGQLVAGHLKLPGDQADALATQCAAAVNDYLTRYSAGLTTADPADPDGPRIPTPSASLGATMLAARLHRRRNSPGGLESIDGTVASYVARSDPDVARLLGIDAFAAPSVG